MLEKHQIIILVTGIALALLIGIPTAIEITGYNSGIDISGTVDKSTGELEDPDNPVKIKFETSDSTSSYYYSPENDTQIELTKSGTTTMYKVQSSNRVKYTEYDTEGVVSTRKGDIHLSIATEEEKVQYDLQPPRISELVSEYNIESVDLEEESSNRTIYVAKHSESDRTLTLTVSNDRIQKIETDSMTVTIDYDAGKIQKPEPPEPDTDGEEEKDCSEIENCEQS